MSKISGRLANKYAVSLLKAVKKQQGDSGVPTPAQKVAAELKGFVEVWNTSSELKAAMSNPMFEKDERLKAILKILSSSGLSEIAQRFVQVCFERDRISYIPEIVDSYALLADKEAKIVAVEVVTAKQISAEEKQKIEKSVKNQVEGEPRFSWTVDAEIIGGVVIRFGDKVIDGSISGRINRLEEQLFRAQL